METSKLILVLLFLSFSNRVISQCSVDSSFGVNGQVEYSFNNSVRPMVIRSLADGKCIVGGFIDYDTTNQEQAFFAKLLADGRLDTSFGDTGIALPFAVTTNSYLNDFIVKSDGKITGVMTQIQGKIFQLNSDGSPDTIFGFNGMKPVNSNIQIRLTHNGQLITAGQYWNGSNSVLTLNKMLPDGSPDTSFGFFGYKEYDISPFTFEFPQAMEIQSDGKILLDGTVYNSATEFHFFITRINADGNLDNTFGTNGSVVYTGSDYFGRGELYDLSVLDNGKILACGYRDDANASYGWYGLLMRLNSNGTEDATFGDSGRVLIRQVYNSNSRFYGLTVLDDGSILLAGTTTLYIQNTTTGISVHKVSRDGIIDTTFFDHGMYFNTMSGSLTNVATDIIDSAGSVLLCAFVGNDIFLRRDMTVIKLNECGLVKEIPSPNEFTVFPNPTDGHFKIEGLSGKSSIRIFNTLGQIVYSDEDVYNETEINLQGSLNNGIYFISILNDDQQLSIKILKY